MEQFREHTHELHVKHARLSTRVREQISLFLTQGMGTREIVCLCKSMHPPDSRSHFVSEGDVRNIRRKMDPRRLAECDIESVRKGAEVMNAGEDEPYVRFLKLQGDHAPHIVRHSTARHTWDPESTVAVYQSPWQREMLQVEAKRQLELACCCWFCAFCPQCLASCFSCFSCLPTRVTHTLSRTHTHSLSHAHTLPRDACVLQRYGENYLGLDSTHNTNKYGYHLVSIVVRDANDRGVVVGHCVTNKGTTDVIAHFLRETVAIHGVTPRIVVTDDDPAEAAAIKEVFGDRPRHLLCIFHTKKAL